MCHIDLVNRIALSFDKLVNQMFFFLLLLSVCFFICWEILPVKLLTIGELISRQKYLKYVLKRFISSTIYFILG